MIPVSKPFIGEAEKSAVLRVLDSGMIVQGPETAALEANFCKITGAKHAIATSSGTTALHLALLAHGVGPNDEVITTPFTFMASANSILYTGARPVFVDIENRTYNIDPALIEASITPRTKAILPVHIFGHPCELDAISEIARRRGLMLIEDAAQAVGAEYKGKRIGSFNTSCFSLYATKNIMSAEGGMITTNDDHIAEQCRLLRTHGMRRRYYHDMLGFNFRMTDIHAAIGNAQVARLEDFTNKRRANAAFLDKHLKRVHTPVALPHVKHVYHQYSVRIDGGRAARDAAVEKLTAKGVGTAVFYPVPSSRQTHLLERGLGKEPVPVAEQVADDIFSLPVHPQLSGADLEKIVSEVNAL